MSDAPRGDTPGDVTNEPRRPLISPVIVITVILAVLIAGGVWGYVFWAERNTNLPPIGNPNFPTAAQSAREAETEEPEPAVKTAPSTRPTTGPTTREAGAGQAR